MSWLITIIAVAIIAGIIGALSSKDGEKEKDSLLEYLQEGMDSGYLIFQIFWIVGGLILPFKIFSFLFG